MINILGKKLRTLVYGDEGVALVVTLALFMFMYVSCAGVFAVGQTLREKVILQNACDAAAYSAAVVEADVLSRMAAINKTMAWTYESMVARQMDCAVYEWLDKAVSEYHDAEKSHPGVIVGDETGKKGFLTLYYGKGGEKTSVKVSEIELVLDGYEADGSFFSSPDLRAQIAADRAAIGRMSEGLAKLREEFPSNISNIVDDVLQANLPDHIGCDCLAAFLARDCFDTIETESELLSGNIPLRIRRDRYDWVDGGDSLKRNFSPEEVLKAVYTVNGSPVTVSAEHDEAVLASANAVPIKTVEGCFSDGESVAEGAISVAVAKLRWSPWRALIRTVTTSSSDEARGLHGIFAQSSDAAGGRSRWTWAFASAQAGYAADGHYKVDGEDYENLFVTDWDAVMVPVRHAMKRDEFAKLMTSEANWYAFAEAPTPNLVARYAETRYDSSPTEESALSEALPRMHNVRGALHDPNWEQVFEGLMWH